MRKQSAQQVYFRPFFFWLHPMTCGILVSDQGWNLYILQWKLGVLTAGLPGKSQLTSFERDQTVDATLPVQEGLPLRATPHFAMPLGGVNVLALH